MPKTPPVLHEIRRIRVRRQNVQTGVANNVIYDTSVAKYLVYDTAARSRHTPRVIPRKPRLRWYVVGLSSKISCTLNGSVLYEIRRTLVHPQKHRTGCRQEAKNGPYLQHRCRTYVIFNTVACSRHTPRTVSYTHLTLPTKA